MSLSHPLVNTIYQSTYFIKSQYKWDIKFEKGSSSLGYNYCILGTIDVDILPIYTTTPPWPQPRPLLCQRAAVTPASTPCCIGAPSSDGTGHGSQAARALLRAGANRAEQAFLLIKSWAEPACYLNKPCRAELAPYPALFVHVSSLTQGARIIVNVVLDLPNE